jgi:hypothetical protein
MRIRYSNPLLAICLALVGASRITTYVAYPQGFRSPDTMTYFNEEFLNFDLVSFMGHASRGWVVPSLFAFMPNSSSAVFLQLTISTFAWAYLLISLSKVLLDKKICNFMLLATTVLASAPQVIQHDTVILATSITNSLLVLLIALFLRILYFEQVSYKAFATLILIAAMLMVQKPTFIPISLVFVLLAIYSKRDQVNLTRKIVAVAAISMSVAYSLVLGSNVNSNWQISYSGQTLLWQLGGQSPVATEFAAHLNNQGAPKCLISEAPYQDLNVSIGKILNDCPAGAKFLKEEIQREFVSFLVTNPRAAVELVVIGAGASSTNSASNYGGAVSILPKFLSDVFFGTTAPNITDSNVEDQVEGLNLINSGKPFWIFAPIFGWLLLASIGIFFRKNLNREEYILYIALLFSLLQAALVVVLLPSEWVRQTVPFVISVLVLSMLLSAKFVAAIFDSTTKRDS